MTGKSGRLVAYCFLITILCFLSIFPTFIVLSGIRAVAVGESFYFCEYRGVDIWVIEVETVYFFKPLPRIHTPMICDLRPGLSVYLDLNGFVP